MSRDVSVRFARKIERRAGDDCWHWTGKLNQDGYGVIMFQARRIPAMHVALLLDGKPRTAECALHSCDNPSCVNPAHLRWGTRLENTKDMDNRARRGVGWRKKPKVDWATCEAIRSDPRTGMAIAKALGIGTTTVHKILHFTQPYDQPFGDGTEQEDRNRLENP